MDELREQVETKGLLYFKIESKRIKSGRFDLVSELMIVENSNRLGTNPVQYQLQVFLANSMNTGLKVLPDYLKEQ